VKESCTTFIGGREAGVKGPLSLGRETTEEVVLVPKLRAALKKLNPDDPENNDFFLASNADPRHLRQRATD
jgi:hypothetical protein